MIVPRRAANGRTVADRADTGFCQDRNGRQVRTGPRLEAIVPQGRRRASGSEDRTAGAEWRGAEDLWVGGRDARRRRQSRVKATGAARHQERKPRGRARETGQPIETDATPEQASKDRNDSDLLPSGRRSRTDRTPANFSSAQWGSAAMPGPISVFGGSTCLIAPLATPDLRTYVQEKAKLLATSSSKKHWHVVTMSAAAAVQFLIYNFALSQTRGPTVSLLR